jgi:kynurenine formamidase
MRYVDLSLPIRSGPKAHDPRQQIQIEHYDHGQGAQQIAQMFGVPATLLRDGEGWAVERFTSFGTHSTTHVDAPWHYNSTIGGKPARTIDELPLEWFHGPGVVLDMTYKADADAMSVADAESALERAGATLVPGTIVLVRTDCDRFLEQADYMFRGCGVSAEATRWLHQQGVRVMGIDAWGWDRPLDRQAKEALEQQRPGIFWAAHQADLEYSQIERLANLAALPSKGFQVACFPLRVAGGSGAPARVVAMLP